LLHGRRLQLESIQFIRPHILHLDDRLSIFIEAIQSTVCSPAFSLPAFSVRDAVGAADRPLNSSYPASAGRWSPSHPLAPSAKGRSATPAPGLVDAVVVFPYFLLDLELR
jgi:hypothetical protein